MNSSSYSPWHTKSLSRRPLSIWPYEIFIRKASSTSSNFPFVKSYASWLSSRGLQSRLNCSLLRDNNVASCIKIKPSCILVEDILLLRESMAWLSVPAEILVTAEPPVSQAMSKAWMATVVPNSSAEMLAQLDPSPSLNSQGA
ncbi:unnamed protein product [Polarella glacialis]|uniref:Uncharacterized protein n=1 Tax=Polarella glacialis TaxID=89957 RepID=A0A813GUN2_POLGL|nr:unnamed protein product [Polarella glacialis]